jgi:hypothetical protein
MSNPKSIALTSSELGYLWTGFSINEMAKWYLISFYEQAKDQDVKNIYQFALEINIELLNGRKKLLTAEGYPLPVGFNEADINKSVPALFSDRFLLCYLLKGSRLGLEFHMRAFTFSTREDVRQYHNECVNNSRKLDEKVVTLMLNKGMYWRTPTLPAPTAHEKIQKSSYLDGWIGDTRPLNSMEIANLYANIELLIMIETLCIGFAQSTEKEEFVDLFQKGGTLAKNQYCSLLEHITMDGLPIPPSYSAEMTDSTKRIFSDRIMVTHMAGLYGSLISQYGFALGSVMKHDLLTTYTSLISKAGAFSEKITRFLIDKEWLEKVPGAVSRKGSH